MVLRVYFFFEFWKPFEGFCGFFWENFRKVQVVDGFEFACCLGKGGQVGADLLWTKMPKTKRYIPNNPNISLDTPMEGFEPVLQGCMGPQNDAGPLRGQDTLGRINDSMGM